MLFALTGCGAATALPRPSLPSFYLHLPPRQIAGQPAPVLVVLHGFGGSGQRFGPTFRDLAAANGWVLLAPTFRYHNWWDPAKVRADDVAFSGQLSALLRALPERAGSPTRRHAFILGFSRGAQLADRFAFFYPDQVAAVASLSAGTYTLPQAKAGSRASPLRLPFGTADMPRYLGQPLDLRPLDEIPICIGVGS
ncbi:MAG: alpha/beta fold hydrolase, partial [Chloroflexota bacterium]